MELYPKTAASLKELAIIKREVMLHYMEKNIELMESKVNTGVPASLAYEGARSDSGTPTSDSIRRA